MYTTSYECKSRIKRKGFPKITHPIFNEYKYVNAFSLSSSNLLLIYASKVGSTAWLCTEHALFRKTHINFSRRELITTNHSEAGEAPIEVGLDSFMLFEILLDSHLLAL